MNTITKKLFVLSSFFLLDHQMHADAAKHNKETKTIVLTSPLLRVADQAGIFHGPMIDILQSRKHFIDLVEGQKTWTGAIMQMNVADSNKKITIYCRRPEIMYGASFVVIAPDHELALDIAQAQYKNEVQEFVQTRMNKTLFDRQMTSTNQAIFTGSYAINPLTQELLPLYVSDYASECFDVRSSKARLGFPAHNSKDLEFAHLYKLPIKLVVDVQHHLQGKSDDMGPVVAAPLLDKHGKLTEAYLGEYSACIVVNSDLLNNAPLKDAAAFVIDYLEKNNCGHAHTQMLKYDYNNAQYSIKELAKIETALKKTTDDSQQLQELKKDLRIALNYIQADFLEIGEKFLINLKNTKTLMIALVEESCTLRSNPHCYLLQWSQLKGDVNEKEVFRRDITSIKEFTVFCKDLVNFLGDFAYSCPLALENIRKQN